jgi:hypothetical protein
MALVLPSWFKQRQAKAEAAGDNIYRLFGPNLPEVYLLIRKHDNGRWSAALRDKPDGPDREATQPVLADPNEAWEAGFELYRAAILV